MLSESSKASVIYHNIFDYPLDLAQLSRWKVGRNFHTRSGAFFPISNIQTESAGGFYFIKGRNGIIKKRFQNEEESVKKLKIAKRAALILSKIPTIKLVAITGSLAMNNSSRKSDIDLLIITKSRTVWSTRMFAYLLIQLFGIKYRRFGFSDESDKICLNMWLSEEDLVWNESNRNIYIAHEIGQIIPLVNKDRTYEKFLWKNKWILDYWPNAAKIGKWKLNENWKMKNEKFGIFEKLAYKIQYFYMKNKITREVITPTRALFHPKDWGRVVLQKLSS